jgi:hypothetical protein
MEALYIVSSHTRKGILGKENVLILGEKHRNLSTTMRKFAPVQKTFLEKNLIKSLLISTLDKVIYYKGTFLQGSTKPLFHNINGDQLKKNSPLFSNKLLLCGTKISMGKRDNF